MIPYRLYKKAWVSIDESKETLLSKSDINQLLDRGGWMVRNVYNFDTPNVTSFWYVIKDSFGGLEELSSGARRDVRRSLRTYDVLRITAAQLLEIGYPIYSSAQEAYRVKCDVISIEQYKNLIESLASDSSKDFWVIRHKESGEYIALAINTVKEASCEYNVLKCKPKALRDGTQPYYGLIYEMNRYYLDELGLRYVNDGARSITEHSNIQPFLMQKFKFRKAYCNLKITYKWWLNIIIKLLYPFRKLIPIGRVKALLYMEGMARGDI